MAQIMFPVCEAPQGSQFFLHSSSSLQPPEVLSLEVVQTWVRVSSNRLNMIFVVFPR